MTLGEALEVLYPDAAPPGDYELVAGPDGQAVGVWRWHEPPPTPEQIAAVTPQQVAERRAAKIRAAAGAAVASSTSPDSAASRAAIKAVLTVVNSLHEHGRACRALAAQGNWEPTVQQVADKIATLRAGEDLDQTAPTPLEVAELFGGGRVPAATYNALIARFIVDGAGDPTP